MTRMRRAKTSLASSVAFVVIRALRRLGLVRHRLFRRIGHSNRGDGKHGRDEEERGTEHEPTRRKHGQHRPRAERADDAAEHRAGADEAVETLRLRHRVGAPEKRPELDRHPGREAAGPDVETVEEPRGPALRVAVDPEHSCDAGAREDRSADCPLVRGQVARPDMPSAATAIARYIHGSSLAGRRVRKSASRPVSRNV